MIYSTLSGRLQWSWVKNIPDLRALALRHYPSFVFHDLDDLGEVIPVFTYHDVGPEFEDDCRFLAEAGYRTLDPNTFAQVLLGQTRAPRRSVLLTFDDGLASLWTFVYPLLKRFGLCATAFVVSSVVRDDPEYRPNLDDMAAGAATLDEVLRRGREIPGCSWRELARMQNAGVVHVHSHTARHALVHVGPRVRDFINPATDPYPLGHVNLPVVRRGGADLVERPLVWGRPLFEARPRMAGRRRYFEDEEQCLRCETLVRDRGGEAFFRQSGWRRALHALIRAGRPGPYESEAECQREIVRELAESRETIEARLRQPVRHLCYPWYVGSERSVQASRATGYGTNFWGIIPGSNTVRPGTDPFRIPRLDQRFLRRLPGPGRRPLREILASHFHRQRVRLAAAPLW